MKLISILIFTCSITCAASDLIFTIGAQKMTFYNYKEERITASEKCDELTIKKFCKNYEFLKKLGENYRKHQPKPNAGGENPGSKICVDFLKGVVVMGIDANQNENSFCKLPSGIYVDSGTLPYYSKQ